MISFTYGVFFTTCLVIACVFSILLAIYVSIVAKRAYKVGYDRAVEERSNYKELMTNHIKAHQDQYDIGSLTPFTQGKWVVDPDVPKGRVYFIATGTEDNDGPTVKGIRNIDEG